MSGAKLAQTRRRPGSPSPAVEPTSRVSDRGARDRVTTTQAAIWIALLVASVSLFLAGYRSFQVGTYRDDAYYAILAQSLVHSDRYGLVNVPGEPGGTGFPFVYPLLLSPFVVLFPGDLDAMKVVSLIATLVNAALLFWGWRWLSATRSRWWALAVTGAYVLSPLTVDHTRMVMSEPAFTTFCLAAVLLAERAARGDRPWWGSPALGTALVLAAFTRTVGIVLVAGVFAYLLYARGLAVWKQLALIVAQMAVVLGLVVLATPVRLGDLLPSHYLGSESASLLVAPFVGLARPAEPQGGPVAGSPDESAPPVARKDLKTILVAFLVVGPEQHLGRDVRSVALPFGGGSQEQALAESLGVASLPLAAGLLVSALVLFGWLRWLVRDGVSLFPLFAILYFGSLFGWGWAGPRLLYPIQSQVQLGLLLALEAIVLGAVSLARRLGLTASTGRLAVAGLILALIAAAALKSAQIDDSRRHVGVLEARTTWLEANTAPAAVVMTEAPETDFLYGQRRTVRYPAQLTSTRQLETYLAERGVDYVLVAPAIEWQPSYAPTYSVRAKGVISSLKSLSSEGKVRLVFVSDDGYIQVFKREL